MRYVLWAVKILVFVAVLSFAVKNSEPVIVRYYLGTEWQAPLIFVLLIAFCLGTAVGVIACLGQLFRQRREIARLKRAPPAGEGGRGEAAARGNTQNGN